MFKKLRINFNKFPSILFRNFAFKYNKSNQSLGPLESQLNISQVNSKIKHLIENYKEKKRIPEHDQSFFTENIKFYKFDKKTELAIISEMLAHAYHNRVDVVEAKNKNKSSYKIKDLQEPEKTSLEVPKSSFDIFESFRKILTRKLKSNELTLDDFFEIYQSLNKIKNLNNKFVFILSDCLESLISDVIKNNSKKYNLRYLENNVENLKELSEIPYGKKLIGSLINYILKFEYKEHKSTLKISNKLSEFLPTTFFGYDSDIFINFIVLNSNLKMNPVNEQNYFSTMLYSIKELFGKSDSKDKINNLTPEQFATLDFKLSEMIENLYAKNKNNIGKVNVLFKQFLTLEKLNLFEIKLFPNFIQASNKMLSDYYENHSSNFREDFFEIRSILNFYAKFYVEFKHYIFTENEKEIKIFEDYHNIMLKTYSMMINNKIDWNDYSENNSEFIFNILNLLYSNSFNYIKNKDCEQFIRNNFNRESVEKINEKTIPFQTMQRTLHKIILLNTNVDAADKSETLDYLINKFLDLYENKKTNLKEMNNYFLNLNTTLYNVLLDNYKNEEIITKMIQKIFQIIKMFDFKEEKHIHRLIITIENLKLVQNGKVSDKFSKEFSQIEKVHKQLNENTRSKIWWDKNIYNLNKYTVSEVEQVIKEFGEVSVASWFKNMYNCDFLLKTKEEEKYIEFISPYHLDNFDDVKKANVLNRKYHRKLDIFKYNNKSLIYIPYDEVLVDLNNITKYIK